MEDYQIIINKVMTNHDPLIGKKEREIQLQRLSVIYREVVRIKWNISVICIISRHHPDTLLKYNRVNTNLKLFRNISGNVKQTANSYIDPPTHQTR